MTDIGELVVRIRADAAQLADEMKKASGVVKQETGDMEKAVEGLKEQFQELVPAITIAALLEYSKSVIETASNLDNMANRIGFSASTLAALQPELAKTGSSVDEFSHSVYMMNNFIQQAIDGNPKAIATLDKLGLSATALKALKPEDAMNAVVDAIYRLGNITDQTQAGRDIFSRQWASLIPIMLASKGHLEDLVEDMKATVPSDPDIQRVHDFGTALEDAALKAKNEFITLLASILDVYDTLERKVADAQNTPVVHTPGMDDMGFPLSDRFGPSGHGGTENNPQAGDKPDLEELSRGDEVDRSGRGSNADLGAAAAAKAAADSQKAIQDFIQNLQAESAALSLGKEKLAEYRAEKAAAAAGGKQIADLSKDEKDQIDAATLAFEQQKEALQNLQKEEQKHAQMVAQMEAQISSSLADIAVNYKSLGTTVTGVLQQIAKQILEMNVTTPLVKSIGGTLGGGGLFSGFGKLLGFADGGSPPVGVPSIVGENGPELFVPSQSGTIIPNGRMGGTTVVVQQTFNMSPGLPETVGAAIQQAAPFIAAQAHASVFASIQKGGAESRIAGAR